MTPREAYNGAPVELDDEGRPRSASWGHKARISPEQAVLLLKHHTCREVLASSVVGLLPCPKAQAIRRLTDEWFLKRCARIKEEKGLDAVVDVTLFKVERVKHEAYRVYFHGVAAYTGEGTFYDLN